MNAGSISCPEEILSGYITFIPWLLLQQPWYNYIYIYLSADLNSVHPESVLIISLAHQVYDSPNKVVFS